MGGIPSAVIMSDSFLAAARERAAAVTAIHDGQEARIWCVSDVHTDYEENLRWCSSLAEGLRFKKDVLILAGP